MSNHTKQWAVFEVFSQKTSASELVYRYSLTAPDHEMALVLAKENFFRREPCFNLWVVKRDDIRMLREDERVMLDRLDNKTYRETKGYGYLAARWRKHKQDMLDVSQFWREQNDREPSRGQSGTSG